MDILVSSLRDPEGKIKFGFWKVERCLTYLEKTVREVFGRWLEKPTYMESCKGRRLISLDPKELIYDNVYTSQ